MRRFAALLALAAATMIAADARAQGTADQAVDPTANMRQSRNYDAMVDGNAGYRNARMRQECDPIQSDELRRQCIESFRGAATSSSGASGTAGRPARGTGATR